MTLRDVKVSDRVTISGPGLCVTGVVEYTGRQDLPAEHYIVLVESGVHAVVRVPFGHEDLVTVKAAS